MYLSLIYREHMFVLPVPEDPIMTILYMAKSSSIIFFKYIQSIIQIFSGLKESIPIQRLNYPQIRNAISSIICANIFRLQQKGTKNQYLTLQTYTQKVVNNFRCAYLIKPHHIYINATVKIQPKRMLHKSMAQITSDIQEMIKSINSAHIPNNLMSLTDDLKRFILIPEIKQIVAQQQAASLINFFIVEFGIKADLKESAKILFQLFFNWKVPFQVKLLLKNSLLRTVILVDRLNGTIREENSFQEAALAVTNTMEFANTNYPQKKMAFHSSLIDCPFFQTPVLLTIQMPDNADEVYYTVLFMIQLVLVDIPQDQLGQKRRIKMLNALRIIINVVITEQNLSWKIKIVKYIMQILEGLCDRFLNSESSSNNQTILELAMEMDSWSELTDKFQLIYRYKTSLNCLQGREESNVHCYNYLGWNEELDELVYNLKIQSARTHINLLCILLHTDTSSLTTQLVNIVQEILYSLQYFNVNYQQLEQTAGQLAFRFISLLGIFLDCNQVSREYMLTILNQILIPIITKQMEAKRQVYETNPTQLFQQLQSCLSDYQFQTILTEISKIVELIIRKDPTIFMFLLQYFNYSMQSSQGCYQSTVSMEVAYLRPMEVSTALFILSVVSCQALMHKQVGEMLQRLMVPALYNQLDDYQKIYFFTLMTIHWSELYCNNYEQGTYLFEPVLNPHSSQNLKVFALDFVVNVCEYYFCQPFFETFIRNFTQLQKSDSKWTILGKIIKKHIDRMSDDYLCQLVQVMRLQAEQQMHILLENIEIGRKAESSDLLNYISICKIVAQQCDHCRGKPIQHQLFLLIQNIVHMDKLYMEDQILRLADYLLDQYTTLPNHFISFLLKVAVVYEQNQYQGNPFYAVLNKFTMLCGDNPQMRCKLYEIIMGGLCYFAYFPDDVEKDFSVEEQLNNHLILMANYLLVYGHQMQGQLIYKLNQTLSFIEQMLAQRTNLLILNARNRIVQIICNFYLKQPLCLEKLLSESSNAIYDQFDSFILIYVLTIISALFKSREQKKTVLQILVNLLRAAKQKQINKKEQFTNLNFIEDEQTKSYNAILCYVQPVVKLQHTIAQQITKFFDECFKRDKSFKGAIFTLERRDYEELFPLVKSSKYDPFEQIDLQNIKKSYQKIQLANDYRQPQSRKRNADHFGINMEEQPQIYGSKRRKQPDQEFEKNLLHRIYEKQIKKQYRLQ